MNRWLRRCGWLGLVCRLAAAPEFHADSPAGYSSQTSNEAFPVGNGRLAAMVYGGTDEEIIQFNEDTVWAGTVNDYSHPGASNWLQAIRDHVWAGEGEAAWTEAARDHFMSVPLRQSPYQPVANLRIDTGHGSVSGYRRSLDLGTATAKVEYRHGGVDYTREVFASHPDQVIVVRLSAGESGRIGFTCSFDTVHDRRTLRVDNGDLVLDAQVNVDIDTRRQQTSDVRFQSRLRVLNEGGTVSAAGGSLSVANADAVTLLLAVGTNFVRFDDLSGDPEERALVALDAAAAKGYGEIRADQLADHRELFERVGIELGDSSRAGQSIDRRLEAIDVAANTQEARAQALEGDLDLVELHFQMGRYLMICGSRPGSQPLNLQGKWNNEVNPAWESKMTLNINQEMNYWIAEVGNLGECHVPMIDLVRDLSVSGKQVASGHYAADGWMVHHNSDLWRGAAPINNPGGLWPCGGAWLGMHLWWHYDFSRDPAVLAEIYPLMKGAAEFFDDFLIEDPRAATSANPQWGQYLLTNPSHSPEQPNPQLGDDGEIVAGTTMDNQLIRGLYDQVIEASSRLGVDEDLRAGWQQRRDRLPPNQIGRNGQLQEWLEDVDQTGNQHRHLSHLVGMFPGDEITPQHTPALADAVEVVLGWKGNATNNTSWSQAWKMNLWAALGEGDVAFGVLANLFAKSHTDNLVFSRKGHENQIDGNLGSAAGIARMFLQSDRGEIELLPALPAAIPSGSVSGLKARGGYEVDLRWDGGVLEEAVLRPAVDGTCRVRSAVPVRVELDGSPVAGPEVADNLYAFPAQAGGSYRITPGEPHVAETDSDGDGLPDAVETGTGVFVSADDTGSRADDPDSDDDGLGDSVEVELADMGLDPNVDSAAWIALLDEHGPALGLFGDEQLRRRAAGGSLLEVAEGGTPLRLKLWQSSELTGWRAVGLDDEVAVGAEADGFHFSLLSAGERAFYRFAVEGAVQAPDSPLPEIDLADGDGDGIPDATEQALAAMGFDPAVDSRDRATRLSERAAVLGRRPRSALRGLGVRGPLDLVLGADEGVAFTLRLALENASGQTELWMPSTFEWSDDELRLALPAEEGVEYYHLKLSE